MDDWERAGREAGKKAILKLRYLASGDKKRLQSQEYDLDLTYITPNMIAMAFPAESTLEQAYRNAIEDVSLYLESTHGGHYMVYNLSAEKRYDTYHFNHNVVNLGWPDHHSPPLRHLFAVCKVMYDFLKKDKNNVAVVHCKAGKGRTGTAIAAYFLYSGEITDPSLALETFARARSSNMNGVTVPSQRRYVYYMDKILKGVISRDVLANPAKVTLNELILDPVPDIIKVGNTGAGIKPAVEFCFADDIHNPFYEWKLERTFKSDTDRRICFKFPISMSGDIYIRVYHHQTILGKTAKKMMFRFAFHTSFIENDCLVLDGATELDSPSHGRLKPKKVPPRFRVTLLFNSLTSKILKQQRDDRKRTNSSDSSTPRTRTRSSRERSSSSSPSPSLIDAEIPPTVTFLPAGTRSDSTSPKPIETRFSELYVGDGVQPPQQQQQHQKGEKLLFDPAIDYAPHSSSSSSRSPSFDHPTEHFHFQRTPQQPQSQQPQQQMQHPQPQPHSAPPSQLHFHPSGHPITLHPQEHPQHMVPNFQRDTTVPTFQRAPLHGQTHSQQQHQQQQPSSHSGRTLPVPHQSGRSLSHSSPHSQQQHSHQPHSGQHQPHSPRQSTHTQQQQPHQPHSPRQSTHTQQQQPHHRQNSVPQHSQSMPQLSSYPTQVHIMPQPQPIPSMHHMGASHPYPATTTTSSTPSHHHPPVYPHSPHTAQQPQHSHHYPPQQQHSYPAPHHHSQTPPVQHRSVSPAPPSGDLFDSLPDSMQFHAPLQPQRMHNN